MRTEYGTRSRESGAEFWGYADKAEAMEDALAYDNLVIAREVSDSRVVSIRA